MTSVAAPGWLLTAFALHFVAALVCVGAAGWIGRKGDRTRPDRAATALALLLTAAWCVVVAALGTGSLGTTIAETIRNLAWINVIYRLFAADGRHESLRPIRPVIGALVFVEVLQPFLALVGAGTGSGAGQTMLTFQLQAMFHVLVATGALVLLHNLYVGATSSTRAVLRWSAAGLALLWAWDLNFYTMSYLSARASPELAALHGLVVLAGAVCLAFGLGPAGSPVRLRPSRAVTFQSLSLLVIAAYLVLMLGLAQSFDLLGGDLGRLTQVGFVFLAMLAALYWLPSRRLRGWIRVMFAKHLFQHRYDYRSEWLRFTQTIGRSGAEPFGERVVRAMAEITESPAGLLFLPGDDGALELAARWQWPGIAVPPAGVTAPLAAVLAREAFILDLGELRAGIDRFGEAALVPEWLADAEDAWAIVPLLHFERLTGLVVLAKPGSDRRLDWEDLDLLRLAGQQLASYLAERSVQETLMEAARFDEFNRRMAFVMHDIKNLASQLGLLARNAERHADNPDFRADMLVTLRKSSEKLSALLARLGRYGANGTERREPVDLVALAERVVERARTGHPVQLIAHHRAIAEGDPDALEQALDHLVQNAIDASRPGDPVFIEVAGEGGNARIQVLDSGSGMAPEFVRNGLFKPFVSSKPNGFGIGAFEARELVRGMHGRLEVDSREGLGTRFNIYLPLSSAPHARTAAAL
jgi:putative PEP-CTERM system histidine kinase